MIFLLLLFAAQPAQADRCSDLAKPREFNNATAMQAIFCEYSQEHGATLLPAENTPGWDKKNSSVLATPILSATYRENGGRRGVIVIQRQELDDRGEPHTSHATAPAVSVYVFLHDGEKWVFEKGKMEVFSAGAHGSAPGGKLVKLGKEKYGLWFEGGDIHQGYTNDYALAVVLSESKVHAVGTFDTGQSNQGSCSEDQKEQEGMIGPCWGYEGKPEFISIPDAEYSLLRIAYQGTEQSGSNGREGITGRNKPVCYMLKGSKYIATQDRKCATYTAQKYDEVFAVAEKIERKQPIPSIPRKLLK